MMSHDYVDIDSVENQERHDSLDSGATEYFRMRMPLPSPPSQPSLSQLIGTPPASPSIPSVNAFPRGHHNSFKIPRSTPHRKRSNSSPVLTKNSFRGRQVFDKHNIYEVGNNNFSKKQTFAKKFLKTDIILNLKSVIFLLVVMFLAIILTIKVVEHTNKARNGNNLEELMKMFMNDEMSEDIQIRDEGAHYKAEFYTGLQSNKITHTQHKCCKKVHISSEKFALKEYPHMLGTYENVNKDETKRPTYKLINGKRFLSKPENNTGKLYSWGVNINPNMTWGWMKAMEPSNCPHHVQTWRVWSSASSSWLADDSLSVVCVRNL